MANQLITETWQESYDGNADKLLLFIRRMQPKQDEAEDILQQVYLQLWDQLQKGRSLPVGWLYQKARFLVMDSHRSAQRRRQREWAFSEHSSTLFEKDGRVPVENVELVSGALASIEEDQALVVILKIWVELSFERIGEILEIPANTAASRYRYGLQNMKAALEKGGMR